MTFKVKSRPDAQARIFTLACPDEVQAEQRAFEKILWDGDCEVWIEDETGIVVVDSAELRRRFEASQSAWIAAPNTAAGQA